MSTSAGDQDHLETPELDRESGSLLQEIASHGGYAYAAMSAQAAAGDMRAAEATREMAWEQLHSGPWHSVLPVWRDAFSMACIHVAKLHYLGGEFKEALRILDMGLIMGGTLLKADLESAVEKITAKAKETRVSKEKNNGVGKRFVKEEIDMEELRHNGLCPDDLKLLLKRGNFHGATGFAFKISFFKDCGQEIRPIFGGIPS